MCKKGFSIFLFVVLVQMGYAQHINGLTIVGTPRSFQTDPYPRISETAANWVCLVPYGFTRKGQTDVVYNMDRQWWGEKKEGLIENIKLAKAAGFKIFLKPQVYIPGSWPGELDYAEEGWQQWEKNYTEFILFYADIASEYNVDMFCIGTEFKVSETERPEFWRGLIEKIRCDYNGDLTYSSNWDSYSQVPFWDELDYIGVSSYFPLDESTLPKRSKLQKSWKKVKQELKSVVKKNNKKVLFTEYGYLSVDGCAGKTWELEKRVHSLPINEAAQAISLDNLYEQFWEEEFWAGGFLWKWFPNDQGHEGYIERDYTPKNKEAEGILKKWFSKDKALYYKSY